MTNERLCKNCKAKVSLLDQFCSHCGASVGAVTGRHGDDGTKFYNPIQTPGRGKLTMISGTGGLAGYNLGSQRHVVGRSQGDILFVDDEFMSPEHAMFHYEGDSLKLKDLESLNGVYVREQERFLENEPVYIIVGKQFFRIEPISLASAHLGANETMRFVSPVQDYKFRVVHVLVGGRDGLSVCSQNNNVVIGRQSCDCTIENDPYLSPRHVQIKEERGRIVIRDLGSKNGTFFRQNNEVTLKHGDYLQLGKEIIRVEINS